MRHFHSKNMLFVNTGEVNSGGSDTILNSGAIGSCIVITAFDAENKFGAMAHIMLPGSSPNCDIQYDTKYANDAIEELFNHLLKNKFQKKNIKVCIAGGSNVLKIKNATIGIENIDSVEKLLNKKEYKIVSRSTGGFERRTVLFDPENGSVFYTKGDSKEKILWQNTN